MNENTAIAIVNARTKAIAETTVVDGVTEVTDADIVRSVLATVPDFVWSAETMRETYNSDVSVDGVWSSIIVATGSNAVAVLDNA